LTGFQKTPNPLVTLFGGLVIGNANFEVPVLLCMENFQLPEQKREPAILGDADGEKGLHGFSGL
jgi:hypothetical protein